MAGLQRYFVEDLDRAQAIARRDREKALKDFAVAHYANDLIAVMREVL